MSTTAADPGIMLLTQKVTKATLHLSHRTSSLVGIRTPHAGQRCAIYVLDLNKLAAQHGLPQCDLDNVVSDKITQVRTAISGKKCPFSTIMEPSARGL
jgi:hypothetical protein